MPEFSVLVPLDGTRRSQSALGMLPFLHSVGLSRVRLISVWETIEGGPPSADKRLQEANERARALVGAYLESRAQNLATLDCRVDVAICTGEPAVEILREAEESHVDLIVISTHGRTAFDRWRLGSVADKVIRGASCPTLVIGPNVSTNLGSYKVGRVIVPLDGSKLAEEAVPVAAYLAQRCKAEIELVEVPDLPTIWSPEPGFNLDVDEVLGWLEQAARAYLDSQLGDRNPKRTVLRASTSGQVGEALLAYLEREPADLVVMTSHGRHGLSRWALGSVTGDLLRGPCPVLVVRRGGPHRSRLLDAAAEFSS